MAENIADLFRDSNQTLNIKNSILNYFLIPLKSRFGFNIYFIPFTFLEFIFKSCYNFAIIFIKRFIHLNIKAKTTTKQRSYSYLYSQRPYTLTKAFHGRVSNTLEHSSPFRPPFTSFRTISLRSRSFRTVSAVHYRDRDHVYNFSWSVYDE